MSKEIRHSGRFAEVEYCLQKYFDTYMTPVMREVKSGLEKKQAEEIGEFASSPAGLLRSFTGGVTGMPDDTVQYLRLTGEWNSKTAEDYVAMCRKRIAGDKGLASDLALLAGNGAMPWWPKSGGNATTGCPRSWAAIWRLPTLTIVWNK